MRLPGTQHGRRSRSACRGVGDCQLGECEDGGRRLTEGDGEEFGAAAGRAGEFFNGLAPFDGRRGDFVLLARTLAGGRGGGRRRGVGGGEGGEGQGEEVGGHGELTTGAGAAAVAECRLLSLHLLKIRDGGEKEEERAKENRQGHHSRESTSIATVDP
jgi:hypothetical protein